MRLGSRYQPYLCLKPACSLEGFRQIVRLRIGRSLYPLPIEGARPEHLYIVITLCLGKYSQLPVIGS
jgi:hypothetical protein